MFAPITIPPIGVIHCGIASPAEAPMYHSESSETGVIEVFPPYHEAMSGLEVGQKVVVLSWLHQARRDLFRVYPRGDRSRGLRGVFTTRSPMRPNPIAISELTVLAIREGEIDVSGLDIIDGTPVLDIKSAGAMKPHK